MLNLIFVILVSAQEEFYVNDNVELEQSEIAFIDDLDSKLLQLEIKDSSTTSPPLSMSFSEIGVQND